MYLKEVQIRNYKNFVKERFLFSKGVNVIIGENDSGKTNLMQAIRLLLDKRMDWHEKEISEDMFSDNLPKWQGQAIVISLRFDELDMQKEEEAVLKYISGNKNNEGSLTWICLPNMSLRKQLSGCSDKEELDNKLSEITIEEYDAIVTCGAYEDFLDDKVYNKIVGDLQEGNCNLDCQHKTKQNF